MANLEPLLRKQTHSFDVLHCVFQCYKELHNEVRFLSSVDILVGFELTTIRLEFMPLTL